MSIFSLYDCKSMHELLEDLDNTEVSLINDVTISEQKANDLVFERNMLLTYLKVKGISILHAIAVYGSPEQRYRLQEFQDKLCLNPYGYNPYEVCNIQDGVNYFKQLSMMS